jgi:hypothetical protein
MGSSEMSKVNGSSIINIGATAAIDSSMGSKPDTFSIFLARLVTRSSKARKCGPESMGRPSVARRHLLIIKNLHLVRARTKKVEWF